MPGYRSSADSMEICDKQLELMQAELSEKQHEFDSLNAKWSPVIVSLCDVVGSRNIIRKHYKICLRRIRHLVIPDSNLKF
jgi:hypothetical protein